MTNKNIQPHLQLSEVHKFCFLSGNPDRVPIIANSLKGAKKVAEKRGLITFEGNTPDLGIPISVLTTGMGCPSTAIVLEEAYRAGARIFIRIGSCGALKVGMNIGDIVLPYAAIRDERTSLNYAPMEFPSAPSPGMYQKLVVSAEKLDLNFHVGIVWTTDIYYSKIHDLFKTWANCGANSVEMESALLFVFGSVKKIKTGSILVVDGNLAEGTQKDEGALGDTEERFDQGIQKAITCAIKAVEMF
ncbi:MAG: nucleoside phosphorylase [Candidatus Hodarchaeales archaeon]|jgi:uridine phosphorylase